MANVTVELTFEQLLSAVQRLPFEQKWKLWRALSVELNPQIIHDFDTALQAAWAAHDEFSEDEVMADALQAVAEVRAAHRTARGA
jgi:hypothetical protein